MATFGSVGSAILGALVGSTGDANKGQSADYRDNKAPPYVKTDFTTGETATIEETRWNKQYPYQLAIVRELGNSSYKVENEWVFTLPIPPESMSVSTPFAISTAVTLGGIIEQHNGIPLRSITFSGTMGVYPIRGSGEGLSQTGIIQSIFAGTVQAVSSTISNAKSVANATAGPSNSPNLYADKLELGEIAPQGTGYYQFLLLRQFLENYAVLKKSADNRSLHLALLVWKEKAGYLVTPIRLDARKDRESPHEYRYNLQFTAWKSVDPSKFGIKDAAAITPGGLKARDPSILANLLNRIEYARRTLADSRKAILSINPDFDATVGETLRQVALLIKDAVGVAQTAYDAPLAILHGMRDTVVQQWGNIKDSIPKTDPQIAKTALHIALQSKHIASGTSKLVTDTSPVAKIFAEPEEHHRFFSAVRLDGLALPAHVARQMAEERAAVRKLTRLNFETMRDNMVDFAADYADKVGLSGATFDKTYGRKAVAKLRDATADDYKVLLALNEAIMQMSKMAAYSDTNPNQNVITTVEAIAGFAERSGVAFQVPASKFAVPMPYGITLEKLAVQYLGDPNRWNEIAALNGLRSPYIDEVGFDLALLSNASGNVVTVSDASNLFLGQTVSVYSASVGQTKRRIVDIKKMSPNYFAITLDGTASLAGYTKAAGSKLHAYLPGTVNSQQIIYIPSPKTSSEDPKTKEIPGVNDFDHLLNVGGVDLLLSPTGDLVITDDGDARVAFGLTNIVQYVKIALSVNKGALLQHPGFGLSVPVGSSTADISAKDLLNAVNNMFRDDPTFTGVSAATVEMAGPATNITMSVGITGSDQLIPVSVKVQK